MWTIEGKTATLCPCFHSVCPYSPLENLDDDDGFQDFQSNSLEEILMEHFHKVLIIVLFVLFVCCCKIFQYLWGIPL